MENGYYWAKEKGGNWEIVQLAIDTSRWENHKNPQTLYKMGYAPYKINFFEFGDKLEIPDKYKGG